MRFYDATDGEVLFNGVNVKEYDVDSLRNAFGTVFQDYKNFALSVYENVMCRDCDDDDKKKRAPLLKGQACGIKYHRSRTAATPFDERV